LLHLTLNRWRGFGQVSLVVRRGRAHRVPQEEMVEDGLDIEDVEQAILNGRIARIERDDPRGTKYVVEGIGADGLTPVGSVGRFTSTGRYLIITVYEITDLED